jgi:hypothetical protein
MSSRGASEIFFASDGACWTLEPSNGRYTLYNGGGVAIVSFPASSPQGQTVPQIVSAPTIATDLAIASTNFINYTPPAVAGAYRLNVIVNVTAWTTPATFTIVVTYKDNKGNARTETLNVVRGSTGATAAAITAVDRWYAEIPLFSINNSATAITVSTSGTFTGTPVYQLQAVLESLI